jgi:cell fate regulator YaaT (PSP1 superfamily)
MTREGEFLGTVTGFCAPIAREPRREGDRVVRRATDEDEKRRRDLSHLERDIREAVRHRAHDLGLEMKPLKVHASLAGRTAIVYFSAEKRVDFRKLLRELGRRYRRRIEMRPLGVRDAAKVVGGLGPCGRCLCCTTFMNRFHSVTVRMAKRQNLSLNPAKISGMCGRLMCCLAHEVEQYPSSTRSSRS